MVIARTKANETWDQEGNLIRSEEVTLTAREERLEDAMNRLEKTPDAVIAASPLGQLVIDLLFVLGMRDDDERLPG